MAVALIRSKLDLKHIESHADQMYDDKAKCSVLNEFGEIRFNRVILHSGEWHVLPGAHIAPGEDDVANSRNHFGIVVKRFVEIAKPKHDDGVGKLFFDAEVLLAERRCHRPQ